MHKPPRNNALAGVVKRWFDIAIALSALVLFAPLMLALSLAVGLFLGRPILFAQPRPGLGGRPFQLYKFRTMRQPGGTDGKTLPDADRLTPFGRWLRSTSLDELPELWNVLRGDMSLVGPRPLLMEYIPRYTDEQMRRHEVLPGITGWAQVNGRNRLPWEERFRLDVWYVDNWSLWLDLKILVMTLTAVLRTRDVSQEGHATMEEFKGQE